MAVLINEQRFTRTANIWGVTNNRRGTNTNRVVVLGAPTKDRAQARRGRPSRDLLIRLGAGAGCERVFARLFVRLGARRAH